MNYVLLCEKGSKKSLEPLVKSPENLLSTVAEFADDTIEKIFEQYNPHGVIIADFESEIPLKFKDYRENLRVIYLTEITLDNEEIIKKLLEKEVIVCDKLDFSNLPSSDEVLEILKELKRKKFEEIIAETMVDESFIKSKKTKKYSFNLSKKSLEKSDFNADKTLIIQEKEKEIPKNKVFISVTELQHHVGCTHVSFEIAEFLRQQNLSACVVIWDKNTFDSLAKFYNLENVDTFKINNVSVFKYDMLEMASREHQYIVCDYGFLRDDFRLDFVETAVKIMLVSGANWDLSVITEYLNSSEDSFKTELNYLFYPVKQADFIKLNRQFLRNNFKAFRLQTSPECTLPCKENKAVYSRIFGLNTRKRGGK